MTSDMSATVRMISNYDDVYSVSANDDLTRVSVCAYVDHDRHGGLAPDSDAIFGRIADALAFHSLAHVDSALDDVDPGNREAAEVWIFARC
jgi:hypothetical protein